MFWPVFGPGEHMEEVLCNIVLIKENNDFIARIQSDLGGVREYTSSNIEDVIEQFVMDVQDEFDSM